MNFKFESVELGIYDNNKFTLFDSRVHHSSSPQNTIIHEAVHLLLSTNTMFGTLVYIIDNLDFKTKATEIPFEGILEQLYNAFRKTQEGVATFIELGFIKIKDGSQVYRKTVNDMKDNNKEYYNYFKDLREFLDEPYWERILTTKLIYRLGELALNIDFSDFPLDIIKKPKELKYFFEFNENAILYRPDTRFRYLTKALKDILKKNDNIEAITDSTIAIHAGVKYVEFSSETQLQFIKHIAEEFCTDKTATFFNDIIENGKMFILKDQNFNNDNSIKEIYFGAHPRPLSYFEAVYTDFDSIIQKANCTDGVFSFGPKNANDCMVVFIDPVEGVNYCCIIPLHYVELVFDKTVNPIIIWFDYYDFKTQTFSGLQHPLNREHYVYLDIPYIYSKNYINHNRPPLASATLTQMDNFSIHLFIKMIGKGIIVQPLSIYALPLLLEDIKSRAIDITLSDAEQNGFDPVFCPNREKLYLHYLVLFSIWQVKMESNIIESTYVEKFDF